MGQAKLRGSRDERVSQALLERARIDHERRMREEQAERVRQEMVAAQWRAMTDDQRAARLASAKADAELYGMISGLVHPRRVGIIG
jgi:hypothetical protein